MKTKKFDPFAPEKMEAYLREQHQKGQVLKEISPWSGKMTFLSAQVEDVVYRLDFYQPSKREMVFSPEYDRHYLTFFQDAGWEMVCAIQPYVVWRKPAHALDEPEDLSLYSDRESLYDYHKKIVRYRILRTAFLPLLVFIQSLVPMIEGRWKGLWFDCIVLFVWLLFVGYQVWRLQQLKRRG